MKKVIAILLVTILSIGIVGCSKAKNNQDINDTNVGTETEGTLSGKVSISGSTSVEKMAGALIEEFVALNPDVQITYEAIGSSGGIKNANEKVTNIGTASRELKTEEKGWGLTEKVIAFDGIAVIVHPNNPVSNLTKEQVQKIYKGEITNWKEVGGADKEIVVVSREDGSGTRGAFEEILKFEKELTTKAIISEGNGNVQVTVSGNEQAIGYVSFEYINKTVKALTIEGEEATSENVIAKKYAISRPFIMVYREDNANETTKAFIDFIFSEDGQNIVGEHGIRVK